MLEHAATLLDVGRAIDYYDRFEHAAMIVMAADLAGFSHADLGALTAILRQADDDTRLGPYGRLVEEDDRTAVLRAATALTLADELNRRIPPGVRRADQLQLDARGLRGRRAGARGWHPRGVADRFEQVFGKPLLVVANEASRRSLRLPTTTSDSPRKGARTLTTRSRLHLGRHGGHRRDHHGASASAAPTTTRGHAAHDRGGERRDRRRRSTPRPTASWSPTRTATWGTSCRTSSTQRADLVQGTPKTPFSMMTGIDEGFSLAAFIGYHAGAGTSDAVLDHTYTGFITDVRVNGETWNETHLNAALAGTFGVPVGFVAGDRACCEQAEEKLPWIRTVAVKDGFGNRVGRSRSPETARAEIRDVLREVAEHPDRLELFVPSGPFTLEVDVINTAVADMCALSPGTERRRRAGCGSTRPTSASCTGAC